MHCILACVLSIVMINICITIHCKAKWLFSSYDISKTNQNKIQLLYCLICPVIGPETGTPNPDESHFVIEKSMYNTLPLHNRQLSTIGSVQSKSILHIKHLLKAF